ncbi:MAG: TIGR04282 family arsenosugar biosynthesis glycosyltransferase [Candidatus Tectomicrobia bacterium]|nr:TIGR04282 family arsenosugar biosynthesis glycosyltransferase [Candidatus Tectomicrobia bacterium]
MTPGGRESLILFARPPLPGRAKTRLAPALGAGRAAGLYRAFLLDAAALARTLHEARPGLRLVAEWALEPGEDAAALPLSEWLPGPFLHHPQSGRDLGERMAGALERALAGGGAAVLIGTDFPDLPPGIPLRALEALAAPNPPGDAPLRAAIGPAEDGGYYLIGLNAPKPELFEAIAWGTDEVFMSTMLKLQGLKTGITVLERWRDVDSPADLEALRERRWIGGGTWTPQLI